MECFIKHNHLFKDQRGSSELNGSAGSPERSDRPELFCWKLAFVIFFFPSLVPKSKVWGFCRSAKDSWFPGLAGWWKGDPSLDSGAESKLGSDTESKLLCDAESKLFREEFDPEWGNLGLQCTLSLICSELVPASCSFSFISDRCTTSGKFSDKPDFGCSIDVPLSSAVGCMAWRPIFATFVRKTLTGIEEPNKTSSVGVHWFDFSPGCGSLSPNEAFLIRIPSTNI